MLPPPPRYAVPVRVPFLILVLSGACSIRVAWLLSHGALTTPYRQSCLLDRVRDWRQQRERFFGNIWDALSLPLFLWKRGFR